ncbi:MAG: protein-L-isoaspartate O-methyltransferase [Patescibacteria group bacterium]|nr:protein-L-isoaspartate O-methyltransferase [Patescibacteria group bacterium]
MDNLALVKFLRASGALKTQSLVRAFKKVDRADFVLPQLRAYAYRDWPLPLGLGQTISQPSTVAFMLELLKPLPGQKILDIGCGSGWTVTLLAAVVGRRGRVIGLERIMALLKRAKRSLGRYPPYQRVSSLAHGDASAGWAAGAPYDKIIAAAAAPAVPEPWVNQLKVGGRIVAPVGQGIVVLDKLSDKKWTTVEHPGFLFVPLVFGKDLV